MEKILAPFYDSEDAGRGVLPQISNAVLGNGTGGSCTPICRTSEAADSHPTPHATLQGGHKDRKYPLLHLQAHDSQILLRHRRCLSWKLGRVINAEEKEHRGHNNVLNMCALLPWAAPSEHPQTFTGTSVPLQSCSATAEDECNSGKQKPFSLAAFPATG